jgi:hypothetical protein
LIGGNVAAADTVKQMIEKGLVGDCGAECVAWLFAVKATVDIFTQFLDFSRIIRVNHALGQFAQFLAGELTPARQFQRILNDARLLFRRQLFDFFDDGTGGHAQTIPKIPSRSNAFFLYQPLAVTVLVMMAAAFSRFDVA